MTPRLTATAISKARAGMASFQNRRGGAVEIGVESAPVSASAVAASAVVPSAVVAGGIVSASSALALELVLAVGGTREGRSTFSSGLAMMYSELVVSALVSEWVIQTLVVYPVT
jgi:hypothetical protein